MRTIKILHIFVVLSGTLNESVHFNLEKLKFLLGNNFTINSSLKFVFKFYRIKMPSVLSENDLIKGKQKIHSEIQENVSDFYILNVAALLLNQ